MAVAVILGLALAAPTPSAASLSASTDQPSAAPTCAPGACLTDAASTPPSACAQGGVHGDPPSTPPSACAHGACAGDPPSTPSACAQGACADDPPSTPPSPCARGACAPDAPRASAPAAAPSPAGAPAAPTTPPASSQPAGPTAAAGSPAPRHGAAESGRREHCRGRTDAVCGVAWSRDHCRGRTGAVSAVPCSRDHCRGPTDAVGAVPCSSDRRSLASAGIVPRGVRRQARLFRPRPPAGARAGRHGRPPLGPRSRRRAEPGAAERRAAVASVPARRLQAQDAARADLACPPSAAECTDGRGALGPAEAVESEGGQVVALRVPADADRAEEARREARDAQAVCSADATAPVLAAFRRRGAAVCSHRAAGTECGRRDLGNRARRPRSDRARRGHQRCGRPTARRRPRRVAAPRLGRRARQARSNPAERDGIPARFPRRRGDLLARRPHPLMHAPRRPSDDPVAAAS